MTADPYIAKKTPIYPSATNPLLYEGRFLTSVITQNEYDGSIDHSSAYAWIPSIFTISDDGKAVRIESYINGLGPREQYPGLYPLIENVFLCLLPHFECTAEPLFQPRDTGASSSTPRHLFIRSQINAVIVEQWKERESLRQRANQKEWEKLEKRQEKDKEEAIKREEGEKAKFTAEMLHDWQSRPSAVDVKDPALVTLFKGRSLKVIVKVCMRRSPSELASRVTMTRLGGKLSSSLGRSTTDLGTWKAW